MSFLPCFERYNTSNFLHFVTSTKSNHYDMIPSTMEFLSTVKLTAFLQKMLEEESFFTLEADPCKKFLQIVLVFERNVLPIVACWRTPSLHENEIQQNVPIFPKNENINLIRMEQLTIIKTKSLALGRCPPCKGEETVSVSLSSKIGSISRTIIFDELAVRLF